MKELIIHSAKEFTIYGVTSEENLDPEAREKQAALLAESLVDHLSWPLLQAFTVRLCMKFKGLGMNWPWDLSGFCNRGKK